jgi:hypothetical protein
MLDLLRWDLWDFLDNLLWRIRAMSDQYRVISDRQVGKDNVTIAVVTDGDQPKEKPRPPAGGKKDPTHKPELVPILVADMLNSSVLRVRNS